VANEARRDRITVEPVECVADRDQTEDPLKRRILGRGGNPLDVVDSETLRLVLAELDRFRFLVNGQHLGDVRREREHHLAGATGKVEQPAGTVEV
jgi:hypothetical protein